MVSTTTTTTMASNGGRGSGGGRKRRRIKTDACPVTSMSAELVIGDDNLLRQILIRLPAKPLFRLKLVSKRWLSLISDPQLLLDWKPPKSASGLYIRRYFSPHIKTGKFNYIPLLEKEKSKKSIVSLDFLSDPLGIKIIQSCNGLLLCGSYTFCLDDELTCYYVLNPTTKQFAPIPRPPIGGDNDGRGWVVKVNLAFDPSVSFRYKILALGHEWMGRGGDCQIDIYSSDTKTWTKPGNSFEFPPGVEFENGVFLNGKIHWPTCGSKTSVYYDFSLEKLLPMPMPMDFPRNFFHFGECGGHLQFFQLRPQFDVFEMESDYSKWVVKYCVDLELGIRGFPKRVGMYVLGLVGGAGGGDSCLLLYEHGKVMSYNLKDRSFRNVCDLQLHGCDFNNVQYHRWFTIHPCMETLFPV